MRYRKPGLGFKSVCCIMFLVSPLVVVSIITPDAWLHYPVEAKKTLGFILNTNHRIYRGTLYPGESSFDWGEILRNDGFFMRLEWWGSTAGRQCVVITPTLRGTDIYLDAEGAVDTSAGSGTDLELLKPCPYEKSPW
ncbi:hypothetical protein CFBP1590__3474 [Pseudomonas viridiflava]|uniref:Uncharacterized protein n=1 Tax=Pseudomonas viridiflava TaxID=33069 RepID=A0A1Y6JPH8_PSEVI|nr:hypothetical protein CFBP1590__3474 [Pseudomonas viridiflava]VVO02220.1 hypothetical protein PS689_02762 [Pseudomonas fluorescens]